MTRPVYFFPLLLFLSSLAFFSCTRSATNTEIKTLETKIEELEKDFASQDQKAKAASSDQGLQNELNQNKLLLRSRIDRLRERMKYLETRSTFGVAK